MASIWKILLASLFIFIIFTASVVRAADPAADDESGDDDDDAEDAMAATDDPAGGDIASDMAQVAEEEAAAEAAAKEEHFLQPHPDVETIYVFPNSLGKQPVLPAGSAAEILIGVHNKGPTLLVMKGISGSLHVPQQWSYLVQNFTYEDFNFTKVAPALEGSSQGTYLYTFTPERLLQPRDCVVTVVAYYEVAGAQHASVVFNSTVELVEPRGVIAGESVFLASLLLGLLGLGGMWGYSQLQKITKKSRRPGAKRVETGTQTASAVDAASNEWLQGTALTQKVPTSKTQTRSKSKRIA